jgi:ketosteroid isomerase-like protein
MSDSATAAIPVPARPDPERLDQALEVARRWLPAFCAGRRADEDLYADGVSTWHNVGEWEAPIKTTPSRRRRMNAGAELRVEDVTCRVFDTGFVVQATTVGTSAQGVPVRVPTVLIVSVVDGKIARFEEYTDSAAAEPLFEGSAQDEHFDE